MMLQCGYGDETRWNLLFEGPVFDTAAASSWLDEVIRRTETHQDAPVVVGLALSTHAGHVAVEHGRIYWVLGISIVVHVLDFMLRLDLFKLQAGARWCTYRLISLVTALFAQRVLIRPDKVPVSGKQICLHGMQISKTTSLTRE